MAMVRTVFLGGWFTTVEIFAGRRRETVGSDDPDILLRPRLFYIWTQTYKGDGLGPSCDRDDPVMCSSAAPRCE
jgi:hypothetical protein